MPEGALDCEVPLLGSSNHPVQRHSELDQRIYGAGEIRAALLHECRYLPIRESRWTWTEAGEERRDRRVGLGGVRAQRGNTRKSEQGVTCIRRE